MANRLKIGKQLEKSVIAGSIVKTDANNEQEYVQPGSNGQVLTVVAGIPTWSALPAAAAETVTTMINVQATGKVIGTYSNEAAAVVNIRESVTAFAPITNGYQFVNEDGTIYPFTFVFNNTTPSNPTLDIMYGASVQTSIPLNSYDVNIATTGGFVLNPLTDEITITETDGQSHTIDLSYLKTSLTSTDSSVQLVETVNPDGSKNYDLGVKAHTITTGTVPYTGTELPTAPGVNIGDTTSTKFTDGTVVNFTWNGTAWTDPQPITVVTRYQEDSFTGLTSGNTVVLSQTPITIFVADRNGLNQLRGAGLDYTLTGTTVTFDVPFASSGGGTGGETVRFFYIY